jgi:AraC-like DNA-binding protein
MRAVSAIALVRSRRVEVDTSGPDHGRRDSCGVKSIVPARSVTRTSPSQSAGTLRRMVPAVLLPHLRRARDLVDRHYGEPLDLDALAGAAQVSKYHFARCFAETYGETPLRYLTRRRIERAQDLLRLANLTVTEVCMLVGFSSLGSFSSRFRDLVGESPTEYRDRWAARGGPRIPGCFLFMRGIDRWPAGEQQSGRSQPAG